MKNGPCAPFQDRHDAGRLLAARLEAYRGLSDILVLAIPPGGVPVAFEVARFLGLPLDIFLVRPLNVPGSRALTMGAVASGSVSMLNEHVVRSLRIPGELIEAVTAMEKLHLWRLELFYRGIRPPVKVAGKTVILIDDGLPVGGLMPSAIEALDQAGPERVVVAAPVGATMSCSHLQEQADELICLYEPNPFHSVAHWYRNVSPITDDGVRDLLEQSATLSATRRNRPA